MSTPHLDASQKLEPKIYPFVEVCLYTCEPSRGSSRPLSKDIALIFTFKPPVYVEKFVPDNSFTLEFMNKDPRTYTANDLKEVFLKVFGKIPFSQCGKFAPSQPFKTSVLQQERYKFLIPECFTIEDIIIQHGVNNTPIYGDASLHPNSLSDSFAISLRACIENFIKRNTISIQQRRELAFLAGHNPRCGKKSPLFFLPPHLMQDIRELTFSKEERQELIVPENKTWSSLTELERQAYRDQFRRILKLSEESFRAIYDFMSDVSFKTLCQEQKDRPPVATAEDAPGKCAIC